MGKRPFVPPSDAIVQKAFTPPADAVVEKPFVPPPDAEVEPTSEGPINDTGNPLVSGLVGFGKSAWNVATKQVPMEFRLEDLRNSQGTLASYLNPEKREGEANVQRTNFDFPEANGLREKYNQWLFQQPDKIRSLDNEKRAELFLKQDVGEKKYQELTNKFNTNLSAYRQGIFNEIQQQKKESEALLKGIPQSISDVRDVEGFGKYLGNLAGQGAGRIISSIVTGGTGSVVAERAAVYDRQLDQMAEMASQKSGIPVEQARQNIIALNKDNPEAGRTLADFAALLDIASIPTVVEGGVLGKVVPLAIEGGTEAIQSEIEEKAATQGSGAKYKYDPIRSVDSFLGGVVGAGTVGAITGTIHKDADTGDPVINKEIDEAAGFTPAETVAYNQTINNDETETGIRPEVQGTESQNIEGTGNQESGSSNSFNRPEEIRNQEDVTTVTPQTLTNGSQEENAVQEQGTGSVLQHPQEGVGEQGSERGGVEPIQQGQEAPQESKVAEEKVTPRFIQEQRNKVHSLFNEAAGEQGRGIDLEKLQQAKKENEKLRELENEYDRQKVARAEKAKQTTTINVASALKEQIKAHYQHVATGVKKGQNLVNDLLTKITDTAKEFKLSPAQLSSLVTKVKNTNLFTPGATSKLNSFIDKVSTNAEYAEKLQTAKELKAAVAKRGASSLRDFKERELVSQFKRINPEQVANIDDYNSIAEQLKGGLKDFKSSVNLAQSEKSIRDVVSKIYRSEFNVTPAEAYSTADMLDQLDLRKEEDTTNGHINQLANELGVDFDEAKEIYEGEDKGGNPKQLRDNLLSIAKNKKITSPTTGMKGKIDNTINSIDPELLSIPQLKRYITIINRINENESYADAGSVFAMGLAQEGWRKIKAAPAKFKILNLNYIESKIDSLPLAVKAIFGLKETASAFQLHSGMTDVSDVKDWAVRAKDKLTSELNDLHTKQKEKGFTNESIFRQAIYGNLIAYPEGMNPEAALAANKEIFREMIATYKQAGMSKDAALVSKLFKPFENATTIDEVQSIMGKVDAAGKKAAHVVIDFFTNHKISSEDNRTILEALTDDNEMFHNKDTENIVNYSGSRLWKPVGAVDSGEVNVEDLNNFTSNRPNKPKELTSGYKRSMQYQKGKVLDLNLHLNAINQAEQNVYDIVSKPYRLQVREFASNNEDLMKLFGAEDYDETVDREELSKKELKNLDKKEANKKRAQDIISMMFEGKDSIYHSFERTSTGQSDVAHSKKEKAILGTLSAIKSVGYGMTLSGFTAIAKQVTVLVNVGITTGMRSSVIAKAVELAKNSDAASKFFSGTTVNIRGSSHALLNTGDTIDKAAIHAAKNKVRSIIPAYLQSRFDGKLGWISGISPLLFGDVKSAKASYLAFYEQYLSKHGESYQGLDKENDLRSQPVRKEARAYAKTQVDVLQGVSNPAEQGEWFKNSTLAANAARSFLVPYGHFATNTKSRLYADYVAVFRGNSNQKIEGALDIMSTAAESIAFAGTAQAARAAMLYCVGTLLSKMIGFPEKDDWEDFWEKAKKLIFKDMVFSNLPVVLTSVGETAATDLINWAYFGLLQMDDEELTKAEYEKEYSPLPESPTTQGWYDYLGVYGAVFAGAARAFELQDKGFNEELTDEQRQLALTAAFAQYGQIIGVWPADVSNAMKATFYNEMKRDKESQ